VFGLSGRHALFPVLIADNRRPTRISVLTLFSKKGFFVMSIFKRDTASSKPHDRCRWLARCGVLGLLAGCAAMMSAGKVHAADTMVVNLIGNAVEVDDAHPYKEVSDAIVRFTRSDLEGAEALLEKAKNKYKQLPPSEVMLAKMLSQVQNQGAAVRAQLEKCVKLHPDDPEAYIIFGDQALSEGRLTDAGLLFAQGKAIAAKFTENKKRQREFQTRAENGMALVAESHENWDDARAHLEAWLAIEPKNATAHNRLARVLFRADKSDDKKAGARAAYSELKAAVEAEPKSMSPDIGLAMLYEEAGKHQDDQTHEDAVTFIRRAVTNLPSDTDTRLATLIAAARWALETDQPNEAKEYSDMALKIQPDSPEAKFLRGVAARLFKDTATAEKNLQEVYTAFPMNFAASNQYAQVLAEQNDKKKQQKALEIAEINEKVFGGQNGGQNRQAAETAATLGWVLYNQGQINQADKVMQAIERAGASSPDSLYYKARILEAAGQPENAVKYLKTALTLSKAFVHHRDAQGMKDKLEAQLGTGSLSDNSKESSDSSKGTSSKDDSAPKKTTTDTEPGKSTIGPTTTTGK
jgi:predicted Zn-dependent protease